MYSWFEIINKPSFTPPAIVFQIVWPILYVLMFVSLILFWKSKTLTNNKILPTLLFFAQLTLNLSWSSIFFINHNILLAFQIILLMIILLLLTIILFYKYSKLSAILLTPYLIWIVFACYLTYCILKLN